MKQRYADNIKKNKIDFVIRPHDKVLQFIVVTIAFVIGLVCLTQFHFFGLLFSVFVTCFYLYYSISKIRKSADIINKAEFQNALFSNAIKKETKFFFIIGNNGEIIYKDERIKGDLSDLGDFFAKIKISENKKSELSNAVKSKSYFSTIIEMTDFLVPVLQLKLLPLSRPDGYFLLKGLERSKEAIYAGIMGKHAVGSYTVNSYGKLLSCNKSFLQLIEGYYVEDKYSICLPELINPENEVVLNTCLQNKVHAYVSAESVYDLSGRKYTYGLVTQKNFAISEFMDAAVAIAQCDAAGKILKCNNSFVNLIGFNADLISNITKNDIDFKLFFSKAQQGHFSSCLSLKNGKIVNMIFSRNVSNFVTVFFFDITQYKKIEEQLLHSQKIQSIGELAGGIAHDFNNILTAILGLCDLVLLRCDHHDANFADIVEIKKNSERATSIVSKLLAFSRQQTLQLEVLDMAEIFREVIPLIRRLVGENIILQVDYMPNIGRVKVDKWQMEQVIMNLAINARDAMKSTGDFIIRISEEVVDCNIDFMMSVDDEDIITPGEYILMQFIDNGCGISADIITKVFDPFFSTKKEREGTGLGLSIIYGIIKQFSGYIYIKSIVGEGTTINIYLPKTYENIRKEKRILEDINAVQSLPKDILLVEDEDIVRSYVKRALEREGHIVYDFSSPVEAIDSFSKIEFDVVISDVIMPEMSGVEFVQQVRSINSEVRIIFISGYSEKKLESIGYKYSFLQKPFSLKRLVSKINNGNEL